MPCNPDPKTGVFSCKEFSGGGGGGWAPSCNAYTEHHHHYLNGDVYAKLLLPANGSVGGCCSQCTAEERTRGCDGWQLWNATGPTSNATGDATQCALIQNGSIFLNPDQIVSAANPQGDLTCWYSDPAMKAGFAPYCSMAHCECDVASKLAVGREQHAMCYGGGGRAAGAAVAAMAAAPLSSDAYDDWIEGLACLMDGNWYGGFTCVPCLAVPC